MSTAFSHGVHKSFFYIGTLEIEKTHFSQKKKKKKLKFMFWKKNAILAKNCDF